MTADEIDQLATFIESDWHQHSSEPLRTPPSPGKVEFDRPIENEGWVPYVAASRDAPQLVDENRWARTRFRGAHALDGVIVITFNWPSDDAEPLLYMAPIDVQDWPADDRLNSSIIWGRIHRILSTRDWTTRLTSPVSSRCSVVIDSSAC